MIFCDHPSLDFFNTPDNVYHWGGGQSKLK